MKRIGKARAWCWVLLFSMAVLISGGCGLKGPPVAPEDLLLDTTEKSAEDDADDEEAESY